MGRGFIVGGAEGRFMRASEGTSARGCCVVVDVDYLSMFARQIARAAVLWYYDKGQACAAAGRLISDCLTEIWQSGIHNRVIWFS